MASSGKPLLVILIGNNADMRTAITGLPGSKEGVSEKALWKGISGAPGQHIGHLGKIGLSNMFCLNGAPSRVDRNQGVIYDPSYDSYVTRLLEKELLECDIMKTSLFQETECLLIWGALALRNLKLFQTRFTVGVVCTDDALKIRPLEESFKCSIQSLPAGPSLEYRIGLYLKHRVMEHCQRVRNMPLDLIDPIYQHPVFAQIAPKAQLALPDITGATWEDTLAMIRRAPPTKRKREPSVDGGESPHGLQKNKVAMRALLDVPAAAEAPPDTDTLEGFLGMKLGVEKSPEDRTFAVYAEVKGWVEKEFQVKPGKAGALLTEAGFKSKKTTRGGRPSFNAILDPEGNVMVKL